MGYLIEKSLLVALSETFHETLSLIQLGHYTTVVLALENHLPQEKGNQEFKT